MSKTILITGSTDGIGRHAALAFARQGCKVLLHGRNPDKLRATLEEVGAAATGPEPKGFLADLSDLEAVADLGKELAKHERLDILVNNAGVFLTSQAHPKTDIRFVVNYLAPKLLTEALLPLLRKSDDGRIINLSSAAQTTISRSALLGEQKLDANSAYAQSKLAILMWSQRLAATESELTVIPVNPGSLLNTKMVQEAYGRHFAGVEKGSDILVELSLNTEHRSRSGEYFDNDRGDYGPAHTDAGNPQNVEELLQATQTLLSK